MAEFRKKSLITNEMFLSNELNNNEMRLHLINVLNGLVGETITAEMYLIGKKNSTVFIPPFDLVEVKVTNDEEITLFYTEDKYVSIGLKGLEYLYESVGSLGDMCAIGGEYTGYAEDSISNRYGFEFIYVKENLTIDDIDLW